MGNVFGGGERSLHLSNGGTEVFIDVLMLAVSDLAGDMWGYRFAALLSLQDQNVMGRGAVGFDLQNIAWGTTPRRRARSKGFVLRATALALSRHRWNDLGYDPPLAQDYLSQFKAMVAPRAVEFAATWRAEHGHGPSVTQLCAGLGWPVESRELRAFIVKRLVVNEWLTHTFPVPWTLRPGKAAQESKTSAPVLRYGKQ